MIEIRVWRVERGVLSHLPGFDGFANLLMFPVKAMVTGLIPFEAALIVSFPTQLIEWSQELDTQTEWAPRGMRTMQLRVGMQSKCCLRISKRTSGICMYS